MDLVNEKALKELNLTPAEYITTSYDWLPELEEATALVCVINNERSEGKGYIVGIATQGKKGYQPTRLVLNEHNYNIANQWVTDANQAIFKRPPIETAKIVFSTMGG